MASCALAARRFHVWAACNGAGCRDSGIRVLPGLLRRHVRQDLPGPRIAENKTSRQIAGELYVSYRTVQTHRANICAKLGLKGHNRLLQFALEHKSSLASL